MVPSSHHGPEGTQQQQATAGRGNGLRDYMYNTIQSILSCLLLKLACKIQTSQQQTD